MRFAEGTFPGNPSSTPGSCRSCGIGRLRDGETGVVVTEWWIDMEGVIVLCQACAAEVGRLVPNSEKTRLESELEAARSVAADAVAAVDKAYDIIRSQRAEIALVADELDSVKYDLLVATGEPEPEAPAASKPAKGRRA